MVTGAGGSLGSVLTDRLVALNPFRLVLIDVSEYNLFQLENVIRSRRFKGELEFRIADVRDEPIMRTVFSSHRPDIVFHAAAYKHVPLMERHPVEAFTNNTLSTVSLIRLCEEYEAEQFVLISTDKAVEPSSVLGATKRLAEWYVRSASLPMHCKTVRFGNILASHGSVVPMFVEQILRGGPVTVTHPDMERYFMTSSEACSLVLSTLLLHAAPVYTIRPGDPLRISALATRLIEELRPEEPLRIEYVGMRPGEKLSEELFGPEEQPLETTIPGVVGLRSPAPFSRAELDDYFQYLDQLCRRNMTADLRRALFQDEIAERKREVSN
jgi:FlaA1/EpsC-like NDP-sugar epimerase